MSAIRKKVSDLYVGKRQGSQLMEVMCGLHSTYLAIFPGAGDVLFSVTLGQFRPTTDGVRALAMAPQSSLGPYMLMVFYCKPLRLPVCCTLCVDDPPEFMFKPIWLDETAWE